MSSKRNQEGYLLIDNSASPGVSADFIRHTGMDAPIVPGGTVFESATILCSHCQAIVVLNPLRTRERGYCRSCDHYVCDNPGCNSECKPFRKRIAEAYERAVKGEL